MDASKKKRLLAKGWSFGTAADFLKLTKEEQEIIEVKIALSRMVQKQRLQKHLSQMQFAALIHSSQSRVAKMEKSDPSVSLDLLVRSLFALGVTKARLSRAIALGI